MNRQLVQRYIETSTLLLAPITPHTSEHVWSNLLQKQGTVLTAGYPQAAEPDFVMQRAAQYIEGRYTLNQQVLFASARKTDLLCQSSTGLSGCVLPMVSQW